MRMQAAVNAGFPLLSHEEFSRCSGEECAEVHLHDTGAHPVALNHSSCSKAAAATVKPHALPGRGSGSAFVSGNRQGICNKAALMQQKMPARLSEKYRIALELSVGSYARGATHCIGIQCEILCLRGNAFHWCLV